MNDGNAYFYGDFNNKGRFDFLKDTGRSFFVGQSLQELRSTKRSYFYNITFNNRSTTVPFQLSGNFVITNQASFLKGIVDNRHFGGKIIFTKKAKAFYASHQSFVEGSVQKNGQRDFIFPVGNDGFYRLIKTGDLSEINQFKITYFHKNPTVNYPFKGRKTSITNIDKREYWRIDNLLSIYSTHLMSLSWNRATTPKEFIDAAYKKTLVITRWDPDNGMWINEKGIINIIDKMITTSIHKPGIFTLAKVSDHVKSCAIQVYNFIDIHGANENKYMRIQSDCAQIQKVTVYNRWGVKVFETANYGPAGERFDGYSSGRLTVSKKQYLPTGTYFYRILYSYDNQKEIVYEKKQGFLYLNAD